MNKAEIRGKVADIIENEMVLLTRIKCLTLADQILALFPDTLGEKEIEDKIVSIWCNHQNNTKTNNYMALIKDIAKGLAHKIPQPDKAVCECKDASYRFQLTKDMAFMLCNKCNKVVIYEPLPNPAEVKREISKLCQKCMNLNTQICNYCADASYLKYPAEEKGKTYNLNDPNLVRGIGSGFPEEKVETPKIEEIEPIDPGDVCNCDYGDTDRITDHLIILAGKINKTIDAINKLIRHANKEGR